MTTPRIYVACLASYNSGKLHGAWIDADQDADDIQDEIAAMLRSSPEPNVKVDCPDCEVGRRGIAAIEGSSLDVHYPCATCNGRGKVPSAEEFAIHDHEGFEGIEIGEHTAIESVAMHARLLREHDGAWSAYVGLEGELFATEEGFQERYRGEYRSAEEFAEEIVTETSDLKSMGNLANYIDWERYARDLGFDGWHFVDGGIGVYVFGPG